MNNLPGMSSFGGLPLPATPFLSGAWIFRVLLSLLLGAVLLLPSAHARAGLPSMCQAEGGDYVCRKAEVKEGYRLVVPTSPEDALMLFDSVDAGHAYFMGQLGLCSWKEIYRKTWTETDGVEYTLIATDTWSGEKCEKDLNGGGSFLYRDKIYSCASGFQLYPWGTENYCIGAQLFDAGKELGTPKVCEGNPCNVATGNKFQSEVDYSGTNAGGLAFVRSYNSFAGAWRNTYERNIVREATSALGAKAIVTAIRQDGKRIQFKERDDDSYAAPRDVSETLLALRDANRNIIGWQLRDESDSVESYSADGTLQSITSRAGLSQTLSYETVGGKSALKSVKDAFGRLLSFKNDTNGRLQTMTDPAGNVYTYGYDTQGRLATVTYPGLKIRTYHYNEPAMTDGANLPNALTGITDENQVRFATWKYDASGRAVLSEHAGGVERVSLAYTAETDESHSTQVTDAAGNTRTYNLALANGTFKVMGMNEICDSCADDALTRGYDENGNLTSRVDRTGGETVWTYDLGRNLELTRRDSAGKLTTTDWHDTFRLPKKITTSNRETEFDYDPVFGTLMRKTVTDTDSGSSRTWTYTYFDTTHLLKKIDGPRTDVKDETLFDYDAQGNLASVTDALGYKTRYELYDKNGRVGTITDPNGLVTSFTYDGRGNLKTRKVAQELTTFDYDNVSQLTRVGLPSTEVVTYVYDNAHRLTDIKNSAGERQHFALDLFGNTTKIEHFDATGALTFANSAEFDRYNRLHKTIQAGGQETTFDTDENGVLRSVTDAMSRETRFRMEESKLAEVIAPDQSSVKYAYDNLDQLKAVVNANDVPFIYTRNAFGEAEKNYTRDPDAFVRASTFDEAGNVKTRTDSRGITTTYTWDALNRLKTMSAANAVTIAFTYDAGANAKGRLTGMVDESGTTTRTYNAQGRIETVVRVFGGISFKVRYDYDAAGNLKTLTYPSGKTVTYTYEKERVSAVSVGATTLLSQAKYTPFAGVRSWRWGNGREYTRSEDLNGRIARYSLGTSEKTLTFDDVGNVKEIVDSSDSQRNQKFAYDDLDRVTDYFGGSNLALQEHYEYDLAGNRKSATVGGKTYAYEYAPATDFLASVAGPIAKKWQTDASGSLLSDGIHTFNIDGFRSLRSVTTGTVKVDYLRNGARQRVTKRSTDGSATHFVFDENGLLLAELDRAGATVTEHIWLAAQPVGVIVNGVAYYVFADHLNTPRLITDTADRARWRWHSNPFGSTIPEENPSGLGKLVYGQRFPGQYYDAESGLHYNYFRDYDPQSGRYIQSDPIGLIGGINTYAYVSGSPLSRADPYGLKEYPNDFVGPLERGAYRTSQMRTTVCGNIPPAPPGADTDKNMDEASSHWNPYWFRDQVKNRGPWDYKQRGSLYQDYGNFNYGATALAFGFGELRIYSEAGRAQQAAGTSRPTWGTPGSKYFLSGGVPPFGDDPDDQAQIRRGINYCKCMKNQENI